MALLRCIGVALFLLASLPATALGITHVERNADGIISIADNEPASSKSDGHHRRLRSTSSRARAPGSSPSAPDWHPRGDGRHARACPLGSSFAVDLGAGDDTFTAQRRDGADQRRRRRRATTR